MTTVTERRSTSGVVELRASADGKGKVCAGRAITYLRYSQNLGGFVEQCAPGLADKSIGDGVDVLARYQHDSDMLLGRVSSGTCRVAAAADGVDYEADMPDTSYGRDLAVLLDRGDVRHSSFAFRCLEDEWGFTEQGFPLRTLLQVQLIDVAPVVSPAYLDTTSGLRSLAEQRGLDLDVVTKAAAANALGELMRSRDPIVVDLGAQTSRRDGGEDGQDPCGCCPDCTDAEDVCPGCACEECRGCKPKRSTTTTTGRDAQGATHAPALAMRARRLQLAARRTA